VKRVVPDGGSFATSRAIPAALPNTKDPATTGQVNNRFLLVSP
jgi:hypothetical protein